MTKARPRYEMSLDVYGTSYSTGNPMAIVHVQLKGQRIMYGGALSGRTCFAAQGIRVEAFLPY